MSFLWSRGPLFVREMQELYADPKPHFNTIATFVRGLESKGFVDHTREGNAFRYAAKVSAESYRRQTLPMVLSRLFGGSGLSMVSTLVKEEAVSMEELRNLLADLEKER